MSELIGYLDIQERFSDKLQESDRVMFVHLRKLNDGSFRCNSVCGYETHLEAINMFAALAEALNRDCILDKAMAQLQEHIADGFASFEALPVRNHDDGP